MLQCLSDIRLYRLKITDWHVEIGFETLISDRRSGHYAAQHYDAFENNNNNNNIAEMSWNSEIYFEKSFWRKLFARQFKRVYTVCTNETMIKTYIIGPRDGGTWYARGLDRQDQSVVSYRWNSLSFFSPRTRVTINIVCVSCKPRNTSESQKYLQYHWKFFLAVPAVKIPRTICSHCNIALGIQKAQDAITAWFYNFQFARIRFNTYWSG